MHVTYRTLTGHFPNTYRTLPEHLPDTYRTLLSVVLVDLPFCLLCPFALDPCFPLFLALVLPAFGCFSLGLSLFPYVFCSLPSPASVLCLLILSMQIGLLPLNAHKPCILWFDGDHEDFER